MVDPQRVEQARQLLQQKGYAQPAQTSVDPARVAQAKQLLAQQVQPAPAPAPKKEGFFKSLVKDPIKTLIVKPATRVAQAGIGLLGGEQGKQFAEKDVNVHIPILGDYNIPAQKTGTAGVKQIAGDALKAGSYLYTPGAAAGLTSKPIISAVEQGARAGAVGAGSFSAGEALQQNKSLKDTTIDAAKGAASGALGGAVLGGAGALVSKGVGKVEQAAKKKAVSELTEKYNELFTGTKSGKNVFQKSTNAGKNPSEFLAKNGYVVSVGKGGKLDTQPVIQQIQQNADSFEEVFSKILQEKDRTLPADGYVSLSRLAQDAKSRLATPQNKATGNLSKMNAEIDAVVNELRNQFGDKVNLSTLNLVKRGQWAQTKVFDATKPAFSKDVNYTLGKSAKELIEKHIPEADIRAFNAYLGDHYDAISNLQRLDSKTVNGGKLGKYFARVVGSIAGSSHGPIGSLLGAEAGDAVSRIMQSNSIAGPVKRAILSQITKESPMYGEAQSALSKLQLGQAKLPAPKPGAVKSSVNVPINQPSKVITPGTKAFAGRGALSRQDTPITDQVQEFRSPLGTTFLPKIKKAAGRALDSLNEVTPGLSTKQAKYHLTFTKDGKTETINNIEKADLGGWLQYLKDKGFKYTVKVAGIAALVGAAKKGASHEKNAQPITPRR